MRIGYVGPVPPHPGGIAHHGDRLVGVLRARGHDVTVVSWASQYPRRLYPGEAVRVPPRDRAGTRFLLRWWDPLSWVRAGRAVRDRDLLVAPWVTPFHAPALLAVHLAARRPLVVVAHNALPHERMPFDVPLARLVFRRASRVVAHSRSVAREVERLAPGRPVTVTAMPPLIPVGPAPLPPRPPLRLLCLGIVRGYKGFDVAVDAVSRLLARGRDVELTIAGQLWHDAAVWRERVRDPKLRGRVRLDARYVPDDEVGGLLARHHLVLAPYRSATQSGVVPIALAAGRPVVASRVGGLAEAVADGESGVLVPPGDPEALADAVERAGSGLEALAAGTAAHRPSWEAVADAVVAAR
ncbi:MAG: glycosyl transferase [Acidimicrobiia bacterium]|nr:MAG: glycosyl transferase [Acidimicrobiia bacterium]